MLQVLLGADRYLVENIGDSGRSLAALMPSGCAPALHEANASVMHVCVAALRKIPLVTKVARFQPTALVLMLGTNDAMQSMLWRSGERDMAQQIRVKTLLLVRALQSEIGHDPLVFILQPPLTAAEVATGAPPHSCATPEAGWALYLRPLGSTCSCAAMHTCMYNPALKCTQLHRCISCGPTERIPHPVNSLTNKNATISRSACIRVDVLAKVRRGVASAAKDFHSVPPLPMTPDWIIFADPLHFRPIGSAAIACHVHSSLLTQVSPSSSRDGDVGVTTAARNASTLFCESVMRFVARPSHEGLKQLAPLEHAVLTAHTALMALHRVV
jgi:hypothetical protein